MPGAKPILENAPEPIVAMFVEDVRFGAYSKRLVEVEFVGLSNTFPLSSITGLLEETSPAKIFTT